MRIRVQWIWAPVPVPAALMDVFCPGLLSRIFLSLIRSTRGVFTVGGEGSCGLGASTLYSIPACLVLRHAFLSYLCVCDVTHSLPG